MSGEGAGASAARVVVLLRHPAAHPKTAQGLRAAVGYLTVGLSVTVLLAGPAGELLTAPAPGPARRHLETLRLLGQQVRLHGADEGVALGAARAVVVW